MASRLLYVMGFLAINSVAFGLALSAERMISTARFGHDSESIYSYCLYDVDTATILGISSSALLFISQVYNVVAGNSFYTKKPGGCITILSMINWITFFLAEAYLLWGTLKNAQQPTYMIVFGLEVPECQTRPMGLFGTGAAFILITTVLSKIKCVCFSGYSFGQTG